MAKQPNDDGWSTVSEDIPTIAILDTIGDMFEGTYKGPLLVELDNGESFTRFTFRGTDGESYALNSTAQLKAAMGKVEPGAFTRVTLVREIPTANGAMKEYAVQVRK